MAEGLIRASDVPPRPDVSPLLLPAVRHLTAIDLFAGAGGASQGLRDADFEVVAAVEFDPTASETYRANHKDTLLLTEDIVGVDPGGLRSLLEGSGRLRGPLSLLNACPPCQGFSSRGSRRTDDARNELVLVVPDWVEAFSPEVVVLENVPGLKGDARLEEVRHRLESMGYGTRSYLADAADFGVPQRRRRMILLGVRGAAPSAFPDELVDGLPDGFDRSAQMAGRWIEKAGPINRTTDPVHRARKLRPKTLARVASVPTGGGRRNIPAELQLECHKSLDAQTGGLRATESYGRIAWDEVAPTMTTRCTTPSCGRFIHPNEYRGLSLREAALLQTFPPEYEFKGTYGEIERQIGNALPVRMTTAVARVALRIS